MWRTGGHRKQEDGAGPQLVVVAIDSDKGSQHALKWAADHLVPRGQIFVILHVRRKITTIPTPSGSQLPISEVEPDVASAYLEQIDQQTKELLLPFQCFCSRRGLQCKEVILEETDIPKAIVDFVMNYCVDKLVLGASSRSALMRTFKSDVPTYVSKAAPDFCSVYIISKGKILSIRPASRPNKHPLRQRQFETSGSQFQSVKSEPDAGHRMEATGRSTTVFGARAGPGMELRAPGVSYGCDMNNVNNISGQAESYLDYSYQSTSSCPTPSMTSIDHVGNSYPRDYADSAWQSRLSRLQIENTYSYEQMKGHELNRDGYSSSSSEHSSAFTQERSRNSVSHKSMYSYEQMKGHELNRDGYSSSSSEHSSAFTQERSRNSVSHKSMEDVESEVRRLKLELAQTMDMYNNACREVFSAKQRVYTPNASENMKSEAAHLVEQEAIELAEKEKERCRVLLEAAQAAQKQKMLEIEEKRIPGDRKLLQDMIQKRKVLDGLTTDARYRKYTIEEIQHATDNFSDELKIGEGGYGPVFRATLDHTAVAIKILRPDAAQGAKQFQQEIEVLSCIRHPNMVLLMGACPEYGCLVYEYMANGSLEDRLFCHSNTAPLSWQHRFRIAAEIATGLLFLHQTKPEPLVHRDLKPGNILLDHNLVSKIADVGLARLVPPSVADAVTQYRMTAAAGTFCYIDPEYQQTGMLGIKSDIYALGIILLQLVTASHPMGLAHNVERAMEDCKFEKMLDPNVPDWPMEEALNFAKLALKCAELRKKDRPDLASVVLPELNQLREFAEGTPISSRIYHHVHPTSFNAK
uniref:RING-type E3 ubiquitin transferase n=1 Tax=Anthurium amnicola TaxID=1678845 RepID=A0A1D1Z0D0_9ARAE